jgi:membrane-bound acyltransferase YfiQ involved in biofilm formation
MVSTMPTSEATERVAFSRLLWVGPLTILAAAVANALLTVIAVAVLRPDPAFMPLTQPIPIIFTAAFVLIGVIVFAIVGRMSSRPIALFRRIALVALVLSFIPDILMLVTGFNPGTTVANVAVLLLMHVVAWAITVGMLTRLARA